MMILFEMDINFFHKLKKNVLIFTILRDFTMCHKINSLCY